MLMIEFTSSCPALCRASTSSTKSKDVDGRDETGHDEKRRQAGLL